MSTDYRVTSHYYCALISVAKDRVVEAAPILSWTLGKDWRYVRTYLTRKGCQVELLEESPLQETLLRINKTYLLAHHKDRRLCGLYVCDSLGRPCEELDISALPDEEVFAIIELLAEDEK